MILEALHTTLNPVVTAHPLIGDVEAETPFCLYAANADPVRDKAGIGSYSYTIEIKIVDTTIEAVNQYTESIVTAINAMSGTIDSTVINAVIQTDESGIYFSNPDQVYMNDLEFKIYTQNR